MQPSKKRRLSTQGEGKNPDVYEIAAKDKLQAEEDNSIPIELEDFEPECLSLVVLTCLRDYYDHNVPDYNIPPILLRSQVYYSCISRTDVDRELNELNRANQIKLFCIPSKPNEIAILLRNDFEDMIDRAIFFQNKNNDECILTNTSINVANLPTNRKTSNNNIIDERSNTRINNNNINNKNTNVNNDANNNNKKNNKNNNNNSKANIVRSNSNLSSPSPILSLLDDVLSPEKITLNNNKNMNNNNNNNLEAEKKEPVLKKEKNEKKEKEKENEFIEIIESKEFRAIQQKEKENVLPQNNNKPHPNVHILEQFKANVIHHPEIKISRTLLLELLNKDSKTKITEFGILLRSGFLLKQLDDETSSYLFAIPNGGTVYEQCKQAEKEIRKFVNSRPFGEILEKELLKRSLKKSKLGITFHVKDLLGTNVLNRKQTPSGNLVKIT
jgi:hypothetical protein